MWKKTKTSRWDALKTDKPKSPVNSRWKQNSPRTETRIEKPPIVNSRWKRDISPISKPKLKEELPVNNRWEKPPSPQRRVKQVERTWEDILSEKIKIPEIMREDTPVNTIVRDDEVQSIINCLTIDRRKLKGEIDNYKSIIDDTTSKNKDILKHRDDIELQQKKRALQDLEMSDNKKIVRGYKADLEKKKVIQRKNRNEELDEIISRMKKKYIENRKIIARNKHNLFNHVYELKRISKRMDYLISLLHEDNTYDGWYADKLFPSEEVVKPVLIKTSPIAKTVEKSSWWSTTEDIVKVSIKDWTKDLKTENLFDDIELREHSDSSEENKDSISEHSEHSEVEIVEQEEKNPYADWDSDAIRKKIRFYNKKLRQISKLEKRDDLGEAELNKIKQRENFEYELKLLNEIRPE